MSVEHQHNILDLLLPRAALHSVLTVLRTLAAHGAQGLGQEALRRHTGLPSDRLRQTCAALEAAMLAQPASRLQEGWRLHPCAIGLTLEHAFFCAIGMQEAAAPAANATSITRRVELLVEQATLGSNQSIGLCLRRFPPAPQPPPCAASDGTSLLLAQAAMQVELSLSKHLGGYSLRLLSSAPPVRHRTCHPGQAWRDGEATAVHETARWNAI